MHVKIIGGGIVVRGRKINPLWKTTKSGFIGLMVNGKYPRYIYKNILKKLELCG